MAVKTSEGHWTAIIATADASTPDNVAVLVRSPQFETDVVAVTFTVVDPGANVAKLHVSVPDAMAHPATGGSIVHVRPAGSGSLRLTDVAVPGPPFVAVTVKVAESPAFTGDGAVFVTLKFGHCTAIVAPAVTVEAFPADSDAVLVRFPQFDVDVVAVTFTCADPGAKLPKLHVSVPDVIAHPATGGLIVQVSTAGSGTDNVAEVAVPGPPFVAVTVKVAGSPAFTGVPPTFVTLKFGH